MLLITADVFSGLPNPTWLVTDVSRVRELMRAFEAKREALAPVRSGFDGLGFRGLIVQVMRAGIAEEYDLPNEFRVGNGAADQAASVELAERILSEMPIGERSLTDDAELTEAIRTTLRAQLEELTRDRPFTRGSPSDVLEPDVFAAEEDSPELRVCEYLVESYDGEYWNRFVPWAENNCYNYAVNRRTDTTAQPGSASGRSGALHTCEGATRGVLGDGGRRWGNCFPFGTTGLYIMALVVTGPPRPDVTPDFHFYRLVSGDPLELQGGPGGGGAEEQRFWAHKQGKSEVKNVDNLGRRITNVETCDRGDYIQFCGYFLAADIMRIR